jgi:predicted ATP-dependent serine protease
MTRLMPLFLRQIVLVFAVVVASSQRDAYIVRRQPEEELRHTLTHIRHEVITLAGRGGIGKISLALTVLHKIAEQGTFEYIV